jgi:tyrosyl-tRNA synthetase
MFGERNPAEAKAATWKMLAAELPHGLLPPDYGPNTPVVELVNSTGLVKSKGEARRQIRQGGISVNGRPIRDVNDSIGNPLDGGYYWVRRGKKSNFIFQPSP